MKPSAGCFRWFIALSIVLGIAGTVADVVLLFQLPEDLVDRLQEKLDQQSDFSMFLEMAVFLIVFLVGIVSTVGLLLFQRWGANAGAVFIVPLPDTDHDFHQHHMADFDVGHRFL